MESIKTIDLACAKRGQLMSRAMNHELRKDLLDLLREEGELNVTEIYTHRRFRGENGRYLDQSVASGHLRILLRANLVSIRREGKNIFYRLNEPVLNAAIDSLTSLADLYAYN